MVYSLFIFIVAVLGFLGVIMYALYCAGSQ